MANTFNLLQNLDMEDKIKTRMEFLVHAGKYLDWGEEIMQTVSKKSTVGILKSDLNNMKVGPITTSLNDKKSTCFLDLSCCDAYRFTSYKEGNKSYKCTVISEEPIVSEATIASYGLCLSRKGKEFIVSGNDVTSCHISIMNHFSPYAFVKGYINALQFISSQTHNKQTSYINVNDEHGNDCIDYFLNDVLKNHMKTYITMVLQSFKIGVTLGNDFNKNLISIEFNMGDLSTCKHSHNIECLDIIDMIIGAYNFSMRASPDEEIGIFIPTSELISKLMESQISMYNIMTEHIIPMVKKEIGL